MRKSCSCILILLLSATTIVGQKSKRDAIRSIDAGYEQYAIVANQIWDFAELGYQEVKSSALLQETLLKSGFKVEAGVAGMPTAFIASYGSGEPVIAILGEFDALPGISQSTAPEPTPIEGKHSAHACGHHLFGTASAAAAIAVKDWLITNRKKGTIRFYGTPAEEGGSGKVYLVRDGLFSDVDIVLHWHPGSMNSANYGSSLANRSGKFRFYGMASHAAASPERGRSALDAVEAMNHMVNLMREHVPSDTRIHYVITHGGEAPNVVPAFAEVYMYVRHHDNEEVTSTWERVVHAAEGAALGTDTRMEFEITGGVYSILPNASLAKVMYANLQTVGGFDYTEEEKEFGWKIQKTFSGNVPPVTSSREVMKLSPVADLGGSTDVGDVSWVVPTVGMSAATWVPGTAAHSWQAVAAGGTDIGTKGMMVAAKTLAATAIDLFDSPVVIEEAWKELKAKQGQGFHYESLIGDRKPALDYRK